MLVPIGHWHFTLLVWENDYVRNLKSRTSYRWGHLVIRALRGQLFIKSCCHNRVPHQPWCLSPAPGAPCCDFHLAPLLPACTCLSGHRQCCGPDRMVLSRFHLVASCSALKVVPDDPCQEAGILQHALQWLVGFTAGYKAPGVHMDISRR